MTRLKLTFATCCLLLTAWCAQGIIKIDMPLEKTFSLAKQVVVGRVVKVDRARQRLEVAVVPRAVRIWIRLAVRRFRAFGAT